MFRLSSKRNLKKGGSLKGPPFFLWVKYGKMPPAYVESGQIKGGVEIWRQSTAER